MKLAETILENERTKNSRNNNEIVGQRLKALVYGFNNETVQLLHKTGVTVSSVLPSSVLHAIVIKHLATNSELREAIAQVLLEQEESYSSADGSKWQFVGGAMTALGSVLSGLGRGQTEKATTEANQDQIELQKQLEMERAKAKRTTWLIVGISTVVMIGIILGFVAYTKSKKPIPSIQLQPKIT